MRYWTERTCTRLYYIVYSYSLSSPPLTELDGWQFIPKSQRVIRYIDGVFRKLGISRVVDVRTRRENRGLVHYSWCLFARRIGYTRRYGLRNAFKHRVVCMYTWWQNQSYYTYFPLWLIRIIILNLPPLFPFLMRYVDDDDNDDVTVGLFCLIVLAYNLIDCSKTDARSNENQDEIEIF